MPSPAHQALIARPPRLVARLRAGLLFPASPRTALGLGQGGAGGAFLFLSMPRILGPRLGNQGDGAIPEVPDESTPSLSGGLLRQ